MIIDDTIKSSGGDEWPDEEALSLAFLGLIQAEASSDRRTARRLTIELRRLGWSCVPIGPRPGGERK